MQTLEQILYMRIEISSSYTAPCKQRPRLLYMWTIRNGAALGNKLRLIFKPDDPSASSELLHTPITYLLSIVTHDLIGADFASLHKDQGQSFHCFAETKAR